MKKKLTHKVAIVSIGILLGILGIVIGSIIYECEELEPIIEGILGAIVLIFFYLLFLSSQSPYRYDLEIRFPGALKFLIIFLFLSIVLYLSFQYVYNAILFLFAILG